ncbi:MAG: ArnT family glycosyltransferase [Bacteroidota bacterium]
MKNLSKAHYYIIGVWFIINLVQAAFTGLHYDEAYYWMYSQKMAWGYFEHPPMVAFIIWLGQLFPGELGVRVFIVILSTVTLAIIFNELNEKKDFFFQTIFVFSFPLIHTHIAGFIALPDVPLVFFTVIFLLVYKKFILHPNLKLSILLATAIAAMIYSKYHAFLVIGFTVFSNLKLFRNKYFWTTVVFTLLLLTPHILWLVENEFGGFKYHLLERTNPFRLRTVLPNIISQLLLAGPLTGIIIFWKLSKVKIQNDFQRALLFNILGFYILFFFLSFKTRIEAHWSAAIIPMLMMVTYPLFANQEKLKLWFKRLTIPVIFILILARFYIALDVIPSIGKSKSVFYNREAVAQEIKTMADGKKVGFYNSYATLSNYIFYTGDSAILLSTPTYRFCQYDLWEYEQYANGEPLLAMQPAHLNPPRQKVMVNGEVGGFTEIEEFQSLKKLDISLLNIKKNENGYEINLSLTNNSGHPVFTNHVSEPVLGILQNREEIISAPLTTSSENTVLQKGEKAIIKLIVAEELLQKNIPVTFFTRSKEMIRGEVLPFRYDDLFE